MAPNHLRQETIDRVAAEVARSREKYPGNEHMLVAIMESLGALARDLLCGKGAGHDDVTKEAAQVAAIAIRLMEEGDATFAGWVRKRVF